MKNSEIRFSPTSEELALIKKFKKRFGIKTNTQAVRTLIMFSERIKIQFGDSLAEKTPKKIKGEVSD